MDFSIFFAATAWILPIIFAVTLHEASHGWVAEKFGDKTARINGRVTFNPFKHIDPFGTVILPGLLLLMHSPILLGYAKPVPVDFDFLNPRRLGMFAVAIAGPGVNILLALASALSLYLLSDPDLVEITWWELNLFNSIIINCALAIFNMLPILPLDGGRVVRAFLPGVIGDLYERTEPYGLMIIVSLLFIPPLLGYNFVMKALSFIVASFINSVFSMIGWV